jgi:arylsulfatase A-like enzyme/Tfp pilus assembly protein PilF
VRLRPHWLLLLFSGILTHAASSPAPRTNVILITIDTVRADHVGCYGADSVKTPTLDGMARHGILFERAISQVPLTWPSHAVMLTGTYPFQNGVQDFTGQPLDSKFRSVAQTFKQRGYATGAVVSAFVLDRTWGLARGFDFYDDAFSPEAFAKKDTGLVDRRAAESVNRAIAWLKKAQHRSFFFWLHLYDPHSPYDAPEPFRSEYKAHPYDGEIAYADHELGRLIAWLKSASLYDQSAIVVLSDHGESLGEHGESEHGFFIYNSTVHIPLIVKPAARHGFRPGRISSPVETTAVASTLLQLAGISAATEKQFHPGLNLSASSGADVSAYSETFYPFSSFGWSPLHALQTSRYHFIDAPNPELYDLTIDPEEKNNIFSEQAATVSVLKDKLQKLLVQGPFRSTSAAAGVSPDAQEKLQALGYVSFRSPISKDALSKDLPDPKSKIAEFNSILRAEDAFHAGNNETGRKLLSEITASDPSMYIVPFLLGEASLQEQKWQEAAADFKRCLELNPNFDQAMTGLSRALIYIGDDTGAKQWAQNALRQNPQNYHALHQLGFVESKTDKQAAIADYEKAVAIQGNFAILRRDLGMLYFQQQNYPKAAEHLAKAAELGLNEAPLFNFLGVSYSRTDRLQKAVTSYKRAIELDPSLAEAHLNLGYAYQRLNQSIASKREYGKACKLQQKYCELVPR